MFKTLKNHIKRRSWRCFFFKSNNDYVTVKDLETGEEVNLYPVDQRNDLIELLFQDGRIEKANRFEFRTEALKTKKRKNVEEKLTFYYENKKITTIKVK